MNPAPDVTDKGNRLPRVSKLLPFTPIGLRYSAVELLLALLIFFVAAAFVEDLPYGNLIQSILLTLVMVSAVIAIGERGWSLIVALVLVIPALIGKWAHHLYPDSFPFIAYLITTRVFFLYILGKLFGFILHARIVDLRVLCAGLSGYLMLGLLWIPAYILVANLDQGAFAFNTTFKDGPGTMAGFNALYFSFITLCTVGYGDISPVSNVARMLVVMQAIVGLFYMTVVLARLVSMYSTANLFQEENANEQSVNQRQKLTP